MEQVVDLATRKSGSIAVALVWDRSDETLRVFAYDGLTGEEIVVPVSGDDATCCSIFRSRSAFVAGHSSSTIAYQAESRIESGSTMCFRKIPSKFAPMPSSAPRTRRLRASVLNSTRIAPQSSNALRRSRYL